MSCACMCELLSATLSVSVHYSVRGGTVCVQGRDLMPKVTENRVGLPHSVSPVVKQAT